MDSQLENAAASEARGSRRRARFMVVGAAALAAILIGSVIFLRVIGPPSLPIAASHVPPQASPTPPGFSVFPVNTTTVYVLVTSGPSLTATLYFTVDAGSSWRRLPVPIPTSDRIATANLLADGKLVLDTWDRSDQQITHAYVGDSAGWTAMAMPLQGGGWPRMLDSRVGFYFVTGQSASSNGHDLRIFRTLDTGAHWDLILQLDDAHPKAGGLSLADDHFVGFSDSVHGWLVSMSEPYATVCGPTGWTPAGLLYASEDGGAHWSQRHLSPLPDGSAQLEPPTMIRGSAGYMIATVQSYAGKCPPDPVEYAYATMDGGSTWSAPRLVPALFFSTVDGIDWWATDGARLFRSRDQGANWGAVDHPSLPARDVALGDLIPVGGDNAWSFWVPPDNQAGRVALLRTTDGGETWTEAKLPPVGR